MPEQPEQVRVPYPPYRYDPGKRRLRAEPEVPIQDSYRLNTIRVFLPGRTAIDVIPAPGAQASTVAPGTVFGAKSPAWIVSGCSAFGRICTPEDQASTSEVLYEQLKRRGWISHPAVLMAPGREWLETGVVVLGQDRDEILSTARYHGQEAVLRWDAHGVSTIATGLTEDVADSPPVAVATPPALLGCPMRFGADVRCVREGGPFVSRSIEVATAWEMHRGLLASALGCTVCDGRFVDGRGGPIALVSAFVPSRRGGWQWGPPRPETSVDAAEGDDA